MDPRDRWLSWGLFLTTLATLLVELLDSRLLSVLTWYHVSFLAVSLAMLGMAAGAVFVCLAGERTRGASARRILVWASYAFALAIPLTHLLLIRSRIPALSNYSFDEMQPIVRATIFLTVPFFLSGAIVTIALTRVGGRIGILYGADLVGAAAGCLLIVPLLHSMDLLSAALVSAAFAAAGAFCFQCFAGVGWARVAGGLAVLLVIGAGVHVGAGSPIDVAYPRGRQIDSRARELSIWNAYSHVTVLRPLVGSPFFWGRGKSPTDLTARTSVMLIDGEAGTPMTEWDGNPESIAWVKYDVTSLPYHLRSGDVGIIGVGGGRDILSAIWGGSTSITAIELNETFVDILSDSRREFANIVGREDVRLINDEARSYLTRSKERFDVLQMSLVDTWAATGAGAFTLSENALYTVDAWKIFLSRLRSRGIFSTSRWFSPDKISETSRLLSLCVAALLELGVEEPSKHVALVARGKIATLLVTSMPFSARDLTKLRDTAALYKFDILVMPGAPAADPRLSNIVKSSSAQSLREAIADPYYDFSAPSDQRPYFFNMLKPAGIFHLNQLRERGLFKGIGGVIWGNLRATVTLAILLVTATALVSAIILIPLVWSGLPSMSGRSFLVSLAYFATIGYGFMSVQIPLLQRFSVFIGHPIHTYSVILFAMILFAGIGSFLSDRITLEGQKWHYRIPIATAVLLGAVTLCLQPILDTTIGLGMIWRCIIVVLITAPVSTLMGFCFPIGMRLVSKISDNATAWMWGINGASGVLASILAVAVSMWVGIHANLMIAAALYLLLAFPARALAHEAFSA